MTCTGPVQKMDPLTNIQVILLDPFIEDGSSHQHPGKFTRPVKKMDPLLHSGNFTGPVQKMDPLTNIQVILL
jgi:hypothetical protein